MRRLGWSLVVFPLLLAIPPGAHAASANACRAAAAAPGVKVLARSSKAVVFKRKSSKIFGCTYRRRTVRRLNTGYSDIKYKVAGVYAGYRATGTAIGDESSKVGVFDLRTGKPRIRHLDTDGLISAWRLSTRGSIAWIQANFHADPGGFGPGEYGPDQKLRAVAGTPPRARVIDTGSTDEGGGLANLGLRGGVLSWTNQGEAKTTTLEPSSSTG
jgi:hypothetical protein